MNTLLSLSFSIIHFHFLWFFCQAWWKDLRSDKLDPIDINWMNFILSFLPGVRWPLWSRSLILRLDSESAYKRVRKTFSQFCVIHQHQWPESRSMKKSPGLRTRWTWTVDTHGHSALNMIWFDQIGGRTTQHRVHRKTIGSTECSTIS